MDRVRGCYVGLGLVLLLLASGCMQQEKTLRIATTTSLYDTGLLNTLEDTYERETGTDLRITSQGSGRALALAKRGDVDLLLVHSPAEERTFMEMGEGIYHRCFAYNRFLLLGPAGDPAGIGNMGAGEAFFRIYQRGEAGEPGILFVSRGDSSGTHQAEMAIWSAAGLDYSRDLKNARAWYIETGRGMGESLLVAEERGAYILSDAGTYLAFRGKITLVSLITGDILLLNRYSAIVIDPAKHPGMNGEEAVRFVNWLLSAQGRGIIAGYGVEEYGDALFTPLTEDLCEQAPYSCNCSPISPSFYIGPG